MMDHQAFINAYYRAFPWHKNEKITPFQFGEAQDELARLVLKGQKRGTASLHAVYEKTAEPLPKNGELFLMCGASNEPLAIIQTIDVEIIPYKDISETHALREGEGDGSLKHWRTVHKRFFTDESKTYQVPFHDASSVIFEAFECTFQHPTIPIFESKNLLMRPFAHGDAEKLLKWWNDPSIMKHVGFPKGLNITLPSVRKTINQSNRKDAKNPRYFYAICDKTSGKPIGEISYDQTDAKKGERRIGMKICEADYQGKGLGKEALHALIKHLFETVKVHTIFIDTLHTNTRAQALYEGVGAIKTDVKKAYWTNPEGTVYDAIFYKLTREDYHTTS